MQTPFEHHVTPDRRGFTLVETMFAIVIMGIALTMVAGVVPVGIELSRSSVGAVESKVGSRNAVTFIRSMLTRRHMLDQGVTRQFVEIDVDSLLTTDVYIDDPGDYETTNLTHPLARKSDDDLVEDERKGFRLLARRMDSEPDPSLARNDYLLAIFYYLENEIFEEDPDEDGNEMALKPIGIDSVDHDDRQVSISNQSQAKFFQPGSIVLGQNGSWARIESIDGKTIQLDRALSGSQSAIEPLWTIYEHDGDADAPLPVMSPGLGLLTVRTALRNAP